MQKPIKIGLVEDQLLFRRGIKSILNSRDEFEVIFESENGYSVPEKLENSSVVPDLMLIDLTLPPNEHEEYNGWKVVTFLKENYPSIKIIILSVHEDEYLISKLIEDGANGYLVKDSDPEEVYDAIINTFERGSYINARTLSAIQNKLRGKVPDNKSHDKLTKRELEVLKLVCQQMTASEIAEKLFVSEKTVNGHRNNLLKKTNSKNVTGLVLYAIKHKLIESI